MGDWKPKKGDKVYHICEFQVSNYTLKQKGLEGFRNYGIEVVESTAKEPYKWKKGGLGCVSVAEKRDMGDNANNLFYWKKADYGTRLFATREEAAAVADIRAHEMDLAMWGTKFENRPMYKNWMHWGDKRTFKANRAKPHRLPESFSMAVYEKWINGEITAKQAGAMCGMAESTFAGHGYKLAKGRGDHRKRKKWHKPLPENYNDVYERFEAGQITKKEAAKECNVHVDTFIRWAETTYQKRAEQGIIEEK